ncbi:MAG TPA: M23 family metallopeptidase, partial [Candidatus Saccharimonadales bacterium]|nr:M23 family metallopeptidase [Candidatus Saccharimonadales bacterium]
SKQDQADKPEPKPQKAQYIYAQPTKDLKDRATKKLFGTYVEPGNSPVSPERFQGYHTGTDAEYGDVKADVPVKSIAAGNVIASQYVDGYGGAVAVTSKINGAERVVIYGHLDPNRLPKVGRKLSQGEQFAYLGKGYSSQTDGERKHLHLAILKGDTLNWRGYVQSKSELSAWLNPLTVLNEKP